MWIPSFVQETFEPGAEDWTLTVGKVAGSANLASWVWASA